MALEIKTQIDLTDEMRKLVEQKLKDEMNNYIDDAIEKFEKKKGEIVAGILVSIMKCTDMKILEDRIVFTIENKNVKEQCK